ncbi:microtubule-associated tumor suppressor candidate 2 isoform X2 [Betta splendens]|uniref:Microtubule-associated tumor suppressor candidate 2 isoform X2 n=1 Tax=Betta splendens TaxID=158456 RepID=A0A9W2Y8K8_BETSP|nr:microtubule-associated tumor suppressor candidate 2 isoform X2 [Betta splendens]
MCEREGSFPEGELGNNNQQGGAPPDGDANANEIQAGGTVGDTGALCGREADTAEQDRVVIWGTDSQCDDPELAEFEMLECQELEAYLVEEGEDFVGLTDRKDLQAQTSPRTRATEQRAVLNQNMEERRSVLQRAGEHEISEGKDISRTELSSATDVFVSCLSTISSRTQTTDSWHMASGPYSTISEDLTLASHTCSTVPEAAKVPPPARRPSSSPQKSTIVQKHLDVNLNSTVIPCKDVTDEHKSNNNREKNAGNAVPERERGITEHKVSPTAKKAQEERNTAMDKSTQADVDYRAPNAGTKGNLASAEPKAFKKQGSFDNALMKQNSFDKTLKKQPSFENTLKKQLSFDRTLKKQGSFENTVTSSSSSLERRRPWGSPSRAPVPSSASGSPRRRPPGSPAKVQGIRALSLERSGPAAKPASGIPKPVLPPQKEPEPRRTSPPHKPKNVRPKIITYVRKTHPEASNDAGTHPLRSTSYCSPAPPRSQDPKAAPPAKSTPVLCSSNLLFDRYRQELQRAGHPPPSTAAGSGAPQRLSGRSDSFHEGEHQGSAVHPSPRTLRPQLGLGAVARQPAARTRVQQPGQRSAPAARVSVQGQRDAAGDQRSSGPEVPAKSLLAKPGQTGLRPPGFSALSGARLAALGFVRSSSASSVSSNQSSDGAEPFQSLRREMQRDTDPVPPSKSSPKRLAVVPPKPQSPVHARTVHRQPGRSQELDRALIQQLRDRCEQQAVQLQSLQAQLKKAFLCMDVFSITTQHFCLKSESAIVKERELSLELARIRDEVAVSVAHWEQLQQEKEELERGFQAELLGLRARQRGELEELEERLKAQHAAHAAGLRAQRRAELEELRVRQQRQIQEMSESHEASLMEMEATHGDTLATLQEEQARTVKNLKMAHEQQRKSLEEEFEKIRLSLQDQVDTLTFQNRSLRDRAKRFEEALRRSTDEQIVDALAPYKHIEEDLKSLKEVLEMKNQQIHQQELKISELEKIAEKNVYLEERVQILQQQNEDLKARIDKNLAVSRQLSEENANLQVHVEKESNEKKRLSRTNEELLWRLQTGELSPRMSPSSSPVHRPSSGPGSPARPHSYHQ